MIRTEYMTPMTREPEDLNEDNTINPFRQDLFHMGTKLGSNVTILHRNFDSQEAKYLIIVNTKTGERMKLEFED